MMFGVCKLTGQRGKFVKSHILPRALSDRNFERVGRIQGGQGERPSIRYTSWYDQELVTEEGEAKLSQIDNDGISELARLGLCWRYFPITVDAKRTPIGESDFEVIEIEDANVNALRLFFLSILWRAVASRRPEFRDIKLDVNSKRKLGKIINGEIGPHVSDFPATLVALITKGEPHTQTPVRVQLPISRHSEGARLDEKIYRLFLDGLVVHIGRKSLDGKRANAWGRMVVGSDKTLFLLGRPYDGSRQKETLDTLRDDLERTWPDECERIYRAL